MRLPPIANIAVRRAPTHNGNQKSPPTYAWHFYPPARPAFLVTIGILRHLSIFPHAAYDGEDATPSPRSGRAGARAAGGGAESRASACVGVSRRGVNKGPLACQRPRPKEGAGGVRGWESAPSGRISERNLDTQTSKRDEGQSGVSRPGLEPGTL